MRRAGGHFQGSNQGQPIRCCSRARRRRRPTACGRGFRRGGGTLFAAPAAGAPTWVMMPAELHLGTRVWWHSWQRVTPDTVDGGEGAGRRLCGRRGGARAADRRRVCGRQAARVRPAAASVWPAAAATGAELEVAAMAGSMWRAGGLALATGFLLVLQRSAAQPQAHTLCFQTLDTLAFHTLQPGNAAMGGRERGGKAGCASWLWTRQLCPLPTPHACTAVYRPAEPPCPTQAEPPGSARAHVGGSSAPFPAPGVPTPPGRRACKALQDQLPA